MRRKKRNTADNSSNESAVSHQPSSSIPSSQDFQDLAVLWGITNGARLGLNGRLVRILSEEDELVHSNDNDDDSKQSSTSTQVASARAAGRVPIVVLDVPGVAKQRLSVLPSALLPVSFSELCRSGLSLEREGRLWYPKTTDPSGFHA